MRLKRLYVGGLFGLFDHEVPFDLDRRITLIHAPNGYGKTVILKLIAGFFGGALKTFRDYEYGEIVFEFDNGTSVVVSQASTQPELDFGIQDKVRKSYKIKYLNGDSEQQYDPQDAGPENLHWAMSTAMIERSAAKVTRVGPNRWRDNISQRLISTADVYAIYGHLLPQDMRKRIRLPEWLTNLRGSINCRLIDTHRLFTLQQKDNSARAEESSTPTAKIYSEELAREIGNVLANSAIEAQRLDQTFPSRILKKLASNEVLPDEDVLRVKLAELIVKRSRLASAGLSDARETDEFLSHDQFDDSTRRVFDVYVEDTSRKLSVYDNMLAKLELFKTILNSRLQFKNVSFSKEAGFKFHDIRGRHIAPEALSSGEQHELVLNFDLLFHSRKNNLILIDEPELSLHIAWQKRFIRDLSSIIELTGIDTVLCTHSPQLIGDLMDRAVQLKAPINEQLSS